jgi:hypothetical protein
MQQNCCKYIFKKWNYENNKNIPLINQNASDREMFNQWSIPLINWPDSDIIYIFSNLVKVYHFISAMWLLTVDLCGIVLY